MTSVLTFVPQQWREEFPHILLHDCGSGLQQEIGEIFIQVVFTTQVSNSLIQDVTAIIIQPDHDERVMYRRSVYGRILTSVVSTDRTQRGVNIRPRSRFSHTDRLSSVNKIFIIWQRRKL